MTGYNKAVPDKKYKMREGIEGEKSMEILRIEGLSKIDGKGK